MFPTPTTKPSAGSCRTCNTAFLGRDRELLGPSARFSAALRLIDKNGIDSVLADLRARGQA
jgi:hypothetical protein